MEVRRRQRAVDEQGLAGRGLAQDVGGHQPHPGGGLVDAVAAPGQAVDTACWRTSSSPTSRLAYSRVDRSEIPEKKILVPWLVSTASAKVP